MLDNSKKNVLLTKKISLQNLKREKSITSNVNDKLYESNVNTNSDNYEWIFDIYIPNLIDLVEEHKKQVKKNLITDSKLDKVRLLNHIVCFFFLRFLINELVHSRLYKNRKLHYGRDKVF